MTAPSDTFKTRKARLRSAFLAQLPQRISEARLRLAALPDTPVEPEALTGLALVFHTIKGSSASFGLAAISDLARQAEDTVRHALTAAEPMSTQVRATLERTLDQLAVLQARPAEETNAADRFGFEPLPAAAEPAVVHTGHAAQRRAKRIYLCDDDGDLGQQLCTQLACFGYQVTALSSLAELRAAVAAEAPAAVIMDVMFPEGEHAGPAALTDLHETLGYVVPSLFISSRDDFQARLQAVKAGGSAYCTKPVKTTEMVEFLDALTNRESPTPFHVLVVDDEPNIARLHALVLEEAGMTTTIATDPAAVIDLLKGFNADLVLMDMYMPQCSGPELARVLRQMPGHVSLPIIYVSSETDRERQFRALEVGADGFLTKPVEPARLVNEVSLRAERMRTLHALMVRDGLTGLFNHNTIMQFLEIGVANARRDGRPLCFAMIDVDRFKRVNDAYGHPAGDQVLMALSRGLRLRLRECDVVGRYGGEEFAVVLPGVEVEDGKVILDQLRTSFAEVLFYAGDATFRCTFSAGIAAFPQIASADALIEAADVALYSAKGNGRNRVETASANDRSRSQDPIAAEHANGQ
ncbi:diguanylate cyclase [Lamprocystis purpurea]|uniref:diguanylate cyclase n=1 Tax=Lamprocystis purpurea TaxID=61598 RepID=UPI00037337DD|nr:diguanylate cyclase [Lamprocystis purpurea]